jgi:dinuclear metal center YbgI/SA1388 family protein
LDLGLSDVSRYPWAQWELTDCGLFFNLPIPEFDNSTIAFRPLTFNLQPIPMTTTVSDIIDIMEAIAPAGLAESWDNVGLQVGDPRWPVKTVWVALDPLPAVVSAACRAGVDMLITHHPLIFKPLARLNPATPLGAGIQSAMAGRLAIFSAHTNLDSVSGGINDILARRIGLEDLSVLSGEHAADTLKLVVFVPGDHRMAVLEALSAAGAGRIGGYTGCAFYTGGTGTYVPGPESRPFHGSPGQRSQVEELRMEALVEKEKLSRVLDALKSVHPYETMAFDLYPVLPEKDGQGLGRVGRLETPRSLERFAGTVRRVLGLSSVRIAGAPDLPVDRVAVCSGSGGGLLDAFFASGAQVYLSGDLRYHEARDVEAQGLGLVDIGHFSSEHLVVKPLADRLASALSAAGGQVDVIGCELEQDPFRVL